MCFKSWGMVILATVVAQGARASVYVFGDSLSDTGNVYVASGGAYPGPSYYQGRFSNGLLWVDHLAAHYGQTLTPSEVGGTDYAWGGAETGSGFSADGTPNIGLQINAFAGTVGHFKATDLVTLWAGGNDFIDGQTNPLTPAANLGAEINSLYALGARRILVPNLPELGDTPEFVGSADASAINAATLAFNSALHSQVVADHSADAGLSLYELDVNSLFLNVLANPGTYGFNDTTHAYLGSGSTADPNTFVFYDNEHPTAAVHTLIGNAAIAAVPEPATMVGLGLAVTAFLRRKRSK